MAARIRSLVNAINPIDDASRDDLMVADLVTVASIDAAASYDWAIVFAPEDLGGNPSTATFSGDPTAVTPGTFTVDNDGAYLIRLVVDAGLPTEGTQYVRLRSLTEDLGLTLVSAGERRDGTGIIPVDVSSEGWANEQNWNLQMIEYALFQGAGVWRPVTTAGPTYSASNTEFVVVGGDTVELMLPSPFPGMRVGFKQTVVPVDVQIKTDAPGVTIDGTDRSVAGLPLAAQWDQISVVSDGTNWFIFSG